LLNQALLKRGMIVRPVLNYGYPSHVRLTAGTPAENRAAISHLRAVMQEIPPL
jgi:histidinol-phosphate aminotransferase